MICVKLCEVLMISIFNKNPNLCDVLAGLEVNNMHYHINNALLFQQNKKNPLQL